MYVITCSYNVLIVQMHLLIYLSGHIISHQTWVKHQGKQSSKNSLLNGSCVSEMLVSGAQAWRQAGRKGGREEGRPGR